MELPFNYIENFTKCLETENIYCIADLRIKPTSSVSTVWSNILEHNDDHTLYDRRFIHRGFCLPFSGNETTSDKKNVIEMMVNANISNYNLTSSIQFLSCTSTETQVLWKDVIFVSIVVFWLTIIVLSNVLKRTDEKKGSALEAVLNAFSFKKNVDKIISVNINGDAARLAPIQGIRVVVMMTIIFLHTIVRLMCTFYEREEDFEKFLANPVIKILTTNGAVLVNTFLAISTFIHTIKVFVIYSKNGFLTMRDAFILILHRYFRLAIPLIFIVSGSQFSYIKKLVNPVTLRFWEVNYQACSKSWFLTVLLANNYQHVEDMCFVSTWYLSADFQGYVIVTLVLYVILKFKKNILKAILFCLGITMLIHGTVIYFNKTDFYFRGELRNFEMVHLSKSPPFIMLYSGLHSTLAVSFLGMIFGCLYLKTRNYKVNSNNIIYKLIWFALTLGCPISASYFMFNSYDRLARAFIGPTIKPLFVAGPTLLFFGMAHGFGGKLKTFLRWKYFQILSNLSFSIYICNIISFLSDTSCNQGLTKFNMKLSVPHIATDMILSLIFGTLFALLVEYPLIALKNTFLPKIKFRNRTEEGQTNSDELNKKQF